MKKNHQSPILNSKLIILASASPQRAELLHQLVTSFEILPANIEEAFTSGKSARVLTETLATEKARASFKPGSITLGCDTLGELDNFAFGKPADLAEAKKLLRKLSGKTHQVVSAFCLKTDTQEIIGHESASVTFRQLNDLEIEHYIANNPVTNYAGAYAIQDEGKHLVEKFEGELETIVGLPLKKLGVALRSLNFETINLPS